MNREPPKRASEQAADDEPTFESLISGIDELFDDVMPDEFCLNCFIRGMGESVAFGAIGIVVLSAIAVLSAPVAIALVAALVVYGALETAILGLDWDTLSDEEKSRALGDIAGGILLGKATKGGAKSSKDSKSFYKEMMKEPERGSVGEPRAEIQGLPLHDNYADHVLKGEIAGSGSKKRISGAHKEEAFLQKSDLPPDEALGNQEAIQKWMQENPSNKDFVVVDKEIKGDTTYYLYAKKNKSKAGEHTGEINGKHLHEKSTYNSEKISDDSFLKDSTEAASDATVDPNTNMWQGKTESGKTMEGYPHHDDNTKAGTGWYKE